MRTFLVLTFSEGAAVTDYQLEMAEEARESRKLLTCEGFGKTFKLHHRDATSPHLADLFKVSESSLIVTNDATGQVYFAKQDGTFPLPEGALHLCINGTNQPDSTDFSSSLMDSRPESGPFSPSGCRSTPSYGKQGLQAVKRRSFLLDDSGFAPSSSGRSGKSCEKLSRLINLARFDGTTKTSGARNYTRLQSITVKVPVGDFTISTLMRLVEK